MTESQLRQSLLRDEDLSHDEVEDAISEWAEAQIDDWNDRQAENF